MKSLMMASSVLLVCLAGAASAATSVALAPGSGHPGIAATVTGAGFGDNEPVDLYFDTADTELLVTSSTGTFSYSLTVPTTAQPGTHYVTAIGRTSGHAAQFGFNVNTNWSEFGFGGAHLGWNPFENTINTSNVGTLGQLWTSFKDGMIGGTPAVVTGRVFVSTVGGFQALNATTGAVLWTVASTKQFYSSPAVSGNSIYVASTDGVLYAMNSSTGATLWSTTLATGNYSSPVVVNGVIYIGSGNDIYAVQASTGTILWSFATGAPVVSSPAVVNGIVYFGSNDSYVYALFAATGLELWRYQTGSYVSGSPTVVNGVLFVGSYDRNIYAIETVSNPGTVLWSVATSNGVSASPAFYNGIVYVGSGDGYMRALEARTGTVVWSLNTGVGANSASVANGVVYFTDENGNLYGVDANSGDVLLSGNLGPSTFGAPAISNGTLYVSSTERNLNALALDANVNAAPIARKTAPSLASLHPDMRLTAANR